MEAGQGCTRFEQIPFVGNCFQQPVRDVVFAECLFIVATALVNLTEMSVA